MVLFERASVSSNHPDQFKVLRLDVGRFAVQ